MLTVESVCVSVCFRALILDIIKFAKLAPSGVLRRSPHPHLHSRCCCWAEYQFCYRSQRSPNLQQQTVSAYVAHEYHHTHTHLHANILLYIITHTHSLTHTHTHIQMISAPRLLIGCFISCLFGCLFGCLLDCSAHPIVALAQFIIHFTLIDI